MHKGVYKHYKGGTYEVIGLARHSETGEEMVVYRAMYPIDDLGEEFAKDPVFVRPRSLFEDSVLLDGQEVARFVFLGENT